MGFRVFCTNNKGGEGKSLIAANLAYSLARTRRRVLAVDLDRQGNLTRRLGIDIDEHKRRPGIADVLDPDEPTPIAETILSCGWPEAGDDAPASRIDVLPSMNAKRLERRAKESGELGAINRLRVALDRFDDPYHYTLIDAGPSLDHLWDNGAAASDGVLLVAKPEYDGLLCAVRVVDYVYDSRAELGRPDLRILGLVLSDVDEETATHRFNRDNLPPKLPATWGVVPHRKTMIASANDAQPIAALTHTAARDTAEVFDQVAQRLITTMEETAA